MVKQRKFIREEVLADYRLACESRQISLLGRREALGGRANFGIFGDGKEVPQIAMAKFFQAGRLEGRLLPRTDFHDGCRLIRNGTLLCPAIRRYRSHKESR